MLNFIKEMADKSPIILVFLLVTVSGMFASLTQEKRKAHSFRCGMDSIDI